MPLKVIGAGFGRTGTSTLQRALDKLGFGPCYHMREIMRNPPFARNWAKLARTGEVDWEETFKGYSSTVDWPSADYWRQLAEHYPEAKVILTVRDPEKWHASMLKTILAPAGTPDDEMTEQLPPDLHADFMTMHQAGPPFDRDPANDIAIFNRHNEEVKKTIAADRLLVFDVAEGWEPLCRFLGVAVPEEPFPQLNAAQDFGHAVRGL
jgi:hypothetical protein